MEHLLDDLRESVECIRSLAASALRGGVLRGSSDEQIVEALALSGELGRLLDAVQIEAVGEVTRRSGSPERDHRMTTRLGCHDVSELV